MRTITKNALKRYSAQLEEAKRLKIADVSDCLESQVSKVSCREDDEFYVYSHDQLEKDVKNALWDAVVRIQDYYNKVGDSAAIGIVVSESAEELIDSVRKIARAKGGAYEIPVPGEEKIIEVGEDD